MTTSGRDSTREGGVLRDGLRPLDRIAAMRGGVSVDRIRHILADLAAELAPLHARGRVHGAVSLAGAGVDAQGRAHLLAAPLTPAANAEPAAREPGYAAFEQYTDDPRAVCGPWTDIYGLSALGYALAAGEAPPPALRRCVRDDYVPLSDRLAGAGPDAAGFARAIDAGLALDADARPQDLVAFALAADLPQVRGAGTEDEGQQGVAAVVPVPVSTPAPVALSEPVSSSVPGPAPASASVPVAASPVAFADAVPPAMPDAPPDVPEDPVKQDAAAAPAAEESAVAAAAIVAGADRVRAGNAVETHPATPDAAAQSLAPQPASASAPGKSRAPLALILLVLLAAVGAVYFWWRDAQPRQADVVAQASSDLPSPRPPAGAQAPAQPPGADAAVPAVPSTGAESGPGQSAPAGQTAAEPLPSSTVPADSIGHEAAGQAMPRQHPEALDGLRQQGTAQDGAAHIPQNTTDNGRQASSMPPGAALETATGEAPAASSDPQAQARGAQTPLIPETLAAGAGDPSLQTQALAAGQAQPAEPQAEPARPAARAEPSAGKTASGPVTVALRIRPWGEVLVDGRSQGVSPPLRQLRLPAGRHTIVVRNPAGADYRVTLDLSSGEPASISYSFP